ncbi:MAG: hypothetical protein GY811_18135 [Myxococcales bacterium]|nr:hypothetical protein [Myxococcales bacterium]
MRRGDIHEPEGKFAGEATGAVMSSDEKRARDAKAMKSIDDGWALAAGWDEPSKSVAASPASEQEEPSQEHEGAASSGTADTNAALPRARAGLLESRAVAAGPAADEDEADEDEADEDEADEDEAALASPITDSDDRTSAAFRAKIEDRRNKLALASSQSQLGQRKSLLLGLAGGLVVGLGIGWFASQATISPQTVTNSTGATPVSPIVPPAPATEIKPRAKVMHTASEDDLADAAARDDLADAAVDDKLAGAIADASALANETPVQTTQADDEASDAAEGVGQVIPSPRKGVITKIYVKPGQRVWKGERLFEVSRQASDAEAAAEQAAKVAELEAVQERDEAQDAQLAEAQRKVGLFKAGFRGDRKSVAYAEKGGYVDHQLEEGSVVALGEVLGRLRELEE